MAGTSEPFWRYLSRTGRQPAGPGALRLDAVVTVPTPRS